MHVRTIAGLGVALIGLAVVPHAAAVTWVVDASGSGDFTELQPALNAAAPGDSVLVAPGEYAGPFEMACGTVLTSLSGPNATHLVGASAFVRPLLLIENCADPRTEVSGFTIRDHENRLGNGGGCAVLNASVRLTDNVVANNRVLFDLASGGDGAGIYAIDSDVWIENNRIVNNRVRSTFDGDQLTGAGLSLIDTGGVIRGNHIEGNRSSYPQRLTAFVDEWGGGGVTVRSSPLSRPDGPDPLCVIEENTIVDNSAGIGGGLWVSFPSARVVGNTIVRNRALVGGGIFLGACEVVDGNTISENVGFSNAAAIALGGDGRFFDVSASGEVTDNVMTANVCLNPRGGGAVATLGDGDVFFGGNTVTGSVGSYGVACDSDLDWTFVGNTIEMNDFGNFAPSCLGGTVRDSDDATSPASATSARPAIGRVIWVPDDAATIADGLALSREGDTVRVRAGVYDERVSLPPGRALIGDEGPATTEIRGDGAGSTVTIRNGSEGTRLQGFTVSGGRSSAGGGVWISGGSPVVQDCVVAGNEALGGTPGGLGGGVYAENSDALLRDLDIRDNHAAFGAGLAIVGIGGAPALENLVIDDNHAEWFGGGLVLDQTPVVRADSLVVSRNSAGVAGGGLHAYGGLAFFETSTVAFNSAGAGFGSNISTVAGLWVEQSIVAFGTGGPSIYAGDSFPPPFLCSCAWSPGEIEIEGPFIDPVEIFDSIIADPRFCDPGDLSSGLFVDSPCDAACGLMGRYPVGCEVVSVDAVDSPPAARLSITPNPATEFTHVAGEFTGTWHVTVADVLGRAVWSRTVVDRADVTWDLTNNAGHLVSPGIYFVRAVGSGRVRSGRVIVAAGR